MIQYKRCLVCILLLILVFSLVGGVLGVDDFKEAGASIPGGFLDINPKTGQPVGVGDLEGLGENIKEKFPKGEEELLSFYGDVKGWFLSFRIISVVDKFLERISIVFFAVFGEHYSFSIIFLLVLVLWGLVFYWFSRILEGLSALSSWVSYIIGLAIAVISGHLGMLRKMAEGIMWIVNYIFMIIIRIVVHREFSWETVVVGLGLLFGVLILVTAGIAFLNWFKKRREERKTEKERVEISAASKIAEGITDAVSKK